MFTIIFYLVLFYLVTQSGGRKKENQKKCEDLAGKILEFCPNIANSDFKDSYERINSCKISFGDVGSFARVICKEPKTLEDMYASGPGVKVLCERVVGFEYLNEPNEHVKEEIPHILCDHIK